MSTCGSAGLLPALLPVCLVVATFGGAGSGNMTAGFSCLTTVVTAEEEEELPLLPPL